MLRYRRPVCGVLIALLVFGDALRSVDAGGIPFFKKSKPKSCLEEAGNQVDRLERELNQTGTVVIKSPDIWGESRLTKHRQEFEREMEKQVGEFQLLLNANIRRSDQAYLANALAIQAAAGTTIDATTGKPVAVGLPKAADQTFVNSLTTGTVVGPDGTTEVPSTNLPLVRTDIYTGTVGTPHGFTGFGGDNVGLEPTIKLDEMKRYLDHLNEIRRVNEGDDTSDSPGYSLNLVRVPVSILPGEMTRQGHGAEITVTAKPHVSPELLPKVYRDLVINDLVDSLGLAMVKIAEEFDKLAFTPDDCGRITGELKKGWSESDTFDQASMALGKVPLPATQTKSAQQSFSDHVQNVAEAGLSPAGNRFVRSYVESMNLLDTGTSGAERVDASPPLPMKNESEYQIAVTMAMNKNATKSVSEGLSQGLPSLGATARNARQPLATTQAESAYGTDQLFVLAYEFWRTSKRSHRGIQEARSFLKDQLDSGYDYLSLPQNAPLWDNCPSIHDAVRADDRPGLDSLRNGLLLPEYRVRRNGVWKAVPGAPSTVSAGAWLVLVEAALLNAQLNQDLQRVSQDPDCGCQCQGMTYEFFRPVPDEGAKQAFISYVNCRWPVHVFALDPVVQQQNIADQYSMRREMQLALALAFAGGNIGAQSMSRFARRLELDMETIALNKTDVAFGHGSDTFGWRFTPRVQTPPFDSNAKVIVQNFLIGGPNKDQLRRTWELEAGQRECVAIVLMPSFIEHMTFESRGNFFKMADCHLELTNRNDMNAKVAQNVRWSEQMQTLNILLEQVVCEQDKFLPGEVERVRNRIAQLSRRLPMQTVHARVPNENTLGGFEMFSSGVTDLAPELIGFYGEPGVDPKAETIVYLVGKNFSVHDTHVLAGNRECDFSLISREVMQVRIPAGVQVESELRDETKCTDDGIDVHVATPYGVSSHLQIPVLTPKAQTQKPMSWGRTELAMKIRYRTTGTYNSEAGVTYTLLSPISSRKPHELPITVPPYMGTAAAALSGDLIWEEDGKNLSLGTLTAADVPFDAKREAYLLDTDKYRTFTTSAVTLVKDGILEAFHKKSPPPQTIDLLLVGALGGKAIAGDLHIVITLEKAE